MYNQNIWALCRSERHRQERRAQTTAFYLDPGARDIVLDVGCSEGFVSSYLLEANFVVGVDTSIESLLIAKQKTKHSNIDFIRADAADLPFRECSFNKAAMLELLEHLPKEAQKKVCQEVDRILKRKGVIVLSVPYKEQITYIRCVHCGKLTPLWGHLCSMDEEKVTNLLSSHYTLVACCHLPNVGLISLASVFECLPLRLWFPLNNLLGKFRKGYWIILKYRKEKNNP